MIDVEAMTIEVIATEAHRTRRQALWRRLAVLTRSAPAG
jgi:hypothetical protein